jgi:hypothetical protein
VRAGDLLIGFFGLVVGSCSEGFVPGDGDGDAGAGTASGADGGAGDGGTATASGGDGGAASGGDGGAGEGGTATASGGDGGAGDGGTATASGGDGGDCADSELVQCAPLEEEFTANGGCYAAEWDVLYCVYSCDGCLDGMYVGIDESNSPAGGVYHFPAGCVVSCSPVSGCYEWDATDTSWRLCD